MKTHRSDRTNDERLNAVVAHFSQPLTARQLASRLALPLATCSRYLRALAHNGLAACANPGATRSRVYQLTKRGLALQRRLRREQGLSPLQQHVGLNLALYGWLSYRHRTAILQAIDEPLQPAEIKRKARRADPTIKMSANNVRDVIYLFVQHGIARPVTVRGKAHLRYELTKEGRALQALLHKQ